MSKDNGGEKVTLIKVDLEKGSMHVEFAQTSNVALLSHALRLANLQLDNMLIANAQKNDQSSIIKATGIINRIRGDK